MAEHKEWGVELVVTSNHLYRVLARTQEEAEFVAEDMFASGDEGVISGTTLEMITAVSGDEDTLEFEEIDFES